MGKIATLLEEELCYIYCNTCNKNNCFGCNKQKMKWELSKSEALKLEKKILKLFKGDKK